MKKALSVALLVATAVSVSWGAEPVNEQHLEIGITCAKAHEPMLCMESYGFKCHQGREPGRSIEAQHMGCNLELGDGRYHFVQMLYDNGEWNVDVQNTYFPDYDEPRWPEEDPSLALTSYIARKMEKYSSHSSGGGTSAGGQPQATYSGTMRVDRRVAVGAACGTIIGLEYDESASTQLMADCERSLLRTVKGLSQPRMSGPYTVAAPSEFEWDRQFVTLVSGDNALIIEGRYVFADVHMPCRWISDCCSIDGAVYLNSCRAPSERELQIIQSCLEEVGMKTLRSEKFTDCLRTAKMEVGCEDQADGSQVCF
jgi:hypothetical protein